MLRVLVTVAGVLSVSRSLTANTLSADVSVRREESALDCPDASALERRVERIRRAPVREPDGSRAPADVVVSVTFAQSASAYSALVRFRGEKTGERALVDRDDDCEALADAVSVAIALALDTDLTLDTESAPEVPEARSPIPAEPAPSPRSPRSPRRERPPPPEVPWSWGAIFESGAAFEFGSTLSWSVAGRARVRRGGTSLDLGAHAVLPDTVTAGVARLRTSWLFAESAVCHSFGERISVGPCASFAAGRLRGEGVGYGDPQRANLFWVAVAGGALLRGPVFGPVEWGLNGTLWVPLRRLTFSVENAGVVWKSPIISGVLAAGLGASFR